VADYTDSEQGQYEMEKAAHEDAVYGDTSPGDVIAAYADGQIVLDDGITTTSYQRACAFLHAALTAERQRSEELSADYDDAHSWLSELVDTSTGEGGDGPGMPLRLSEMAEYIVKRCEKAERDLAALHEAMVRQGLEDEVEPYKTWVEIALDYTEEIQVRKAAERERDRERAAREALRDLMREHVAVDGMRGSTCWDAATFFDVRIKVLMVLGVHVHNPDDPPPPYRVLGPGVYCAAPPRPATAGQDEEC
jgi:hypothetical protein